MADEQTAEAYRRYEMRLNEARFLVDAMYQEWNKAKSALLTKIVEAKSALLTKIVEATDFVAQVEVPHG